MNLDSIGDTFDLSNFVANHAASGVRVTNTLGTLRTLSGIQAQENRDFNLFTHHEKQKRGEKMEQTYQSLREAVLELYLSVKIRSDEEIDNYNEQLFKEEKRLLLDVDGFTLID